MDKNKIYIDFEKTLNKYKDREKMKDFLINLCKNYEIYIFTTKDRENTYKWLIRYHLDEYIEDVINIKEPAFGYIDDREFSLLVYTFNIVSIILFF
jgi:FMN phosphatase YigB (HAD superfamily)